MNKEHIKSGNHADKKINIAILGATSHIAKGLINNFLNSREVRLHLYARTIAPVHVFLREISAQENNDLVVCEGYQHFSERSYDVIINCIGLGTVSHEPHIYTSFFMVTEEFDNLVISYLIKFPATLYINFSSGAIYGRDCSRPAERDTLNKICANKITRDDCFTIAKLNSEAKHRAFDNLNIIDIRVFSYFSRFIDISGKYFITELFDALIHNKVLQTSETNIVRDYIHPDDLFELVKKCMLLRSVNAAFDAYSLQPAEKMEILNFFSSRFGLQYEIQKATVHHNVTGQKHIYYSLYTKAREIGYQPRFSSMDALSQEAKLLLQRQARLRGERDVPRKDT